MSNKTLIIAEAGVNHNGDLNLAKELIEIASESGADIVKFQTFKAETLVDKSAQKANYQVENTSGGSQFEMLKKLELDIDSHKVLMEHCDKHNIKFLSTPFDLDSVDDLVNLGLDTLKIPSGEITNLPLLRKIGSKRTKVILSTGMSTEKEIGAALDVLLDSGTEKKDITVLHCNTAYPTPLPDVNLKAMCGIQKKFGVDVGYSDHTLGVSVPVAAVALGATVIEKHFTKSKQLEGPDHKASLEANELKEMVDLIREVELALGNEEKVISESEKENLIIARKSIFISRDLAKDHVLTEADIEMKRPGDGISPMEMGTVIGKKLTRSVLSGQKLSYTDID